MREIRGSISLDVHNPEHAEACVAEVDGNFFGCVRVRFEALSDLQIIFDGPSLAEDLGTKLLEMAHELREKQG